MKLILIAITLLALIQIASATEDAKAKHAAPNVAAFTDFWFADPVPAPDFGYTGDWRKSLTERLAQ